MEMDEEAELSYQEKVHKALSEVFGEGGNLVNRWVVIVETLDEDGKDIDYLNSDSLETWESIGLLRTVQVVLEDRAVFESNAVNAPWPDDDDE